eukprot:CAMPEP_0172527824 /NCGR_PEP_ID=MMETSP1067-20121228/2394_1 /TAXON_ID=265564 ORGANISM="Thalassiosira punctigera, Strain Tpunct2005C2" /NCGR_SAMPLE_ID=MMETSP1067 /ASSEMBLY_ACC=CAM_ASM_000444 /LENGTH=217 /DNA_ID=CAMNT_0013311633 /DNA_START=59 /DNA_END=709 /DNA_ORIENTATION=+
MVTKARNNLRRNRLALVATIGVFSMTIHLALDLGDPSFDDYDYGRGLRRRMTTSGSSSPSFINLHGPYGPYKGELEPPERKLADYHIQDDGEVFCRPRRVYGPDKIPNVDFGNTIIVGYPGADKRTVLRQMEAMTQLSGRDAWDFLMLGMTRQPFIKTNYPHHEGIWGWQEHGDQVILVVRNIRTTIDEYHDILSDIDYAKTWWEATMRIPRLYKGE